MLGSFQLKNNKFRYAVNTVEWNATDDHDSHRHHHLTLLSNIKFTIPKSATAGLYKIGAKSD